MGGREHDLTWLDFHAYHAIDKHEEQNVARLLVAGKKNSSYFKRYMRHYSSLKFQDPWNQTGHIVPGSTMMKKVLTQADQRLQGKPDPKRTKTTLKVSGKPESVKSLKAAMP